LETFPPPRVGSRKARRSFKPLESDYNRAEIVRLEARILWAQAWQDRSGLAKNKEAILARYHEALELLLQAGFPSNEIEQEMSSVRRGEQPNWVR
jgi:hypothetical protein